MSRTTTINQHINQSYIMTLNGKLKYLQLFEIPQFHYYSTRRSKLQQINPGKNKNMSRKNNQKALPVYRA